MTGLKKEKRGVSQEGRGHVLLQQISLDLAGPRWLRRQLWSSCASPLDCQPGYTVSETGVWERHLWLILQLFPLSFKHLHARFLPVYKRSWMWWRPQTDYLASWCRYSRCEKANEMKCNSDSWSGGEGWERDTHLCLHSWTLWTSFSGIFLSGSFS